MTKRILTLLLALVLVLTLGACTNKKPNDEIPSGDERVVADFDGLKAEIDFLIEKGDERADAMFDRQAVFYYSVAAAHVCALRYMVDNILWLKGEGNTVADISGDRLNNWTEIAALNYASAYSEYCQYLLLRMQDKSSEANVHYERAKQNPDCPAEDAFYDWKQKSVQDLYKLKTELEGMEDEIFGCYAPNTNPLETINGAEFTLDYHLYLAQLSLELGNASVALEAAENGIAVDPFSGRGYAVAAMCALEMGDTDLMVDYLNEGFFNEPTSPVVNAYLAMIAQQEGDTEKFRTHIDIAKANEPDELVAAFIAALEGG
ncbi:MAG: hypothetical protein IJY39_02705 [Clostridia bacterium]|nr:hypothetical protein [Clostridia bacterium]